MRLIHERLVKENCLLPNERETVAYRIAEIMVTARQMYTQTLPRLTNVSGESQSPMEDDLSGLQMTFLHLNDLLCEFRSTLLQALDLPPEAQEEEDEDSFLEI